MNQSDVRAKLDAAAGAITPSGVPLAGIAKQAVALRRRRRQRMALVVVGAVTAGVLGLTFTGEALWRSTNGEVALGADPTTCPLSTSQRHGSGGWDVVLLRADCESHPLLDGPAADYQPDLSPDGLMVAFARRTHGGTDLMLLDRRTGEVRRLAGTADTLGDPEFSPDGTRIAFWLNDGGGHPFVYTVSVDGLGAAVRLTRGDVNEYWPSWSHDASRIALVAGEGQLVTAEVTTGRTANIGELHKGISHPFWAMDGALLAVATIETRTGASEVQVIRMNPQSGEVLGRSEPMAGRAVDALADGFGVQVALNSGGATSEIVYLDSDLNRVGTIVVDGEPSLEPRLSTHS